MYDYDDQDQDHDKKITQYLIPANVSTRFEIFDGFGWTEAKYVFIAFLVGLGLYLFSGLFTKTEQFNLKDMPMNETIGLKEDKNTKIDGDIVTRRKGIIPNAVKLFFIFIPSAGAFIAVRKDSTTGMSLITNVRASREFAKKQKQYLYKYNSGSGELL